MNIIQGITFHIMAIINASFLFYFSNLANTENFTVENFHNENGKSEKEKTITAGLVFGSFLFIMGVVGLIWDVFFNENIYDGDTAIPIGFIVVEAVLMILIYIFMFVIFYNQDYGVANNSHLSANTNNNAYGAMAVSYVFMTYMILWGIIGIMSEYEM